MRKAIICMIAIAITGLMMASVISIPAKVSVVNSTNVEQIKLNVKQIDLRPQKISVMSQQTDPNQLNHYPLAKADPVFNLAGNQMHPAFGRSGSSIFASFFDQDLDSNIWTGSIDDGATWFDGIYYTVSDDYPSIKVWDSSPRFFGTLVTDYNDLSGGATYIYEVNDVSNLPDTTLNPLQYWDWSTYGWYNMIDADIACDNSQNTFEWGVSSYVMSTTYPGYVYTDGNTIVYSDEATAGSGWISWYNGFDGSAHTDVDIDSTTHNIYAVYDWYDSLNSTWKLLVRAIDDFQSIQTTTNDNIFEVNGAGNLQNPAVAAGNGNIVLLAETDQNGNKDIVCLYGTDPTNLNTAFVVGSTDDETSPDVRYVEGSTFVCTYVKGGNLYTLKSENAGMTWIDESQVNDNADAVVAEYKTSDLCEQGIKAMWEENGPTDIDIWWGSVGTPANQPPATPAIDGPTKLKRNVEYTYTLTTTDPDGNDVYYFVDWGDNTTSDWLGPFASGESATAKHKWTTKDIFTIKCKAKDTNDAESGWATLEVSTPRSLEMPILLQKLLEKFPNAFLVLRHILGL